MKETITLRKYASGDDLPKCSCKINLTEGILNIYRTIGNSMNRSEYLSRKQYSKEERFSILIIATSRLRLVCSKVWQEPKGLLITEENRLIINITPR